VCSSGEEEEKDKCDLEPVTSFAETHVVGKTEKSSFYPKAVQPIIHGQYVSHNTVLFCLRRHSK
jgi:hypothetical protein